MPYIKQEDREKFYGLIELIKVLDFDNPGELNYIFTVLSHKYLDQHNGGYQRMNDVVGALEGAKLELYRRVVSSYEDKKIAENGDV